MLKFQNSSANAKKRYFSYFGCFFIPTSAEGFGGSDPKFLWRSDKWSYPNRTLFSLQLCHEEKLRQALPALHLGNTGEKF